MVVAWPCEVGHLVGCDCAGGLGFVGRVGVVVVFPLRLNHLTTSQSHKSHKSHHLTTRERQTDRRRERQRERDRESEHCSLSPSGPTILLRWHACLPARFTRPSTHTNTQTNTQRTHTQTQPVRLVDQSDTRVVRHSSQSVTNSAS